MSKARYITAALAALALAAVSCRPDGVDGEVLMPFTDIATYEGNTAPGGCATFSVIRDGDEPEATLHSDITLSDTYKTGTRMMIRYTTPSNLPYTSGPVSVEWGYEINHGPVMTEWREEYELWDANPVWLASVWRTGRYINFNLRLPTLSKPRIFTLVACHDWQQREWPELYLAHTLPAGETGAYDREYYSSYDISEVWDSPSTQGVTVVVATDNRGGVQRFEFPKARQQ